MINNFIDLIFPNRCFFCSKILTTSYDILCLSCINELPFSNDFLMENNSFKQKASNYFDLEYAFSLFHYPKNGISRKLIHELKYNNKPRIGEVLGNYFAEQSKDFFLKKEIDGIIYVPITKKRELNRGYNQLEDFSRAIGKKLNVPVIYDLVKREKFIKSQINNTKIQRFKNLENVFKINNEYQFNHSHILILDDVFTTGATLLSLVKTIKEQHEVKISLGVIAYNK